MSDRKSCPQCGVSYPAEERFCPKDGATLRAETGGSLIGSVISDRYLILSSLGEGGMGQVYLAEHLRMKRKSAVKVMRADLAHDPGAAARFNREAEHASQILHPNVAAIFDFGETKDGLLYLAMEYVQGESLARIAARDSALAPHRVAGLVGQIADGLAAAHDLGIVHRDLKPDNIIVTLRKDGSELAKIVDFGIAKAMQAEGPALTQTGYSLGTPEYMSPEQLTADVVDARTDIYALGLITFGLLAGELPFPGGTSRESLVLRLTSRPRTLAEVRQGVAWPPRLQAVLDRALAPDPGERYQTARDFASALTGAVQTWVDGRSAEVPTVMVDGRSAARESAARQAASRPASVPPAASVTRPAARARPAPAPAPTPDRRRSPMPWVIGGVAVLVLAAVIARREGKPAPPPLASDTVVQAPAVPAPAAGSEVRAPAPAPEMARIAPPPPATPRIARDSARDIPTPPPADAAPSRFERMRSLDSLLRANMHAPTPDREALEAALAELERALPTMRAAEQGRARFSRAVLHALLGNTTQACRELHLLRGQIRDRRRRDGTDAYLRRTCGAR